MRDGSVLFIELGRLWRRQQLDPEYCEYGWWRQWYDASARHGRTNNATAYDPSARQRRTDDTAPIDADDGSVIFAHLADVQRRESDCGPACGADDHRYLQRDCLRQRAHRCSE